MNNSCSFLDGLNKSLAPKEWVEFAKKTNSHMGPIWLVDDPSLPRSLRVDVQIFVNIGSAYWENYRLLGASSYEEAVVFRFLHEIGHIASGHTGDPELEIGSKGISGEFQRRVRQTRIEDLLKDPHERQAWEYVRGIKRDRRQEFDCLLEAFKIWLISNR